jgi:hypothetical protein
LKYPHTYGHHHDDIQNRFDAGCHGDITVDQPQPHTDDDQREDEIYQRHFTYSSVYAGHVAFHVVETLARFTKHGFLAFQEKAEFAIAGDTSCQAIRRRPSGGAGAGIIAGSTPIETAFGQLTVDRQA